MDLVFDRQLPDNMMKIWGREIIKYSKWAGYFLALFMLAMGAMKIFMNVPIFIILENNLASNFRVDLPWIDPYFKYFTGVLEVIAAILLLLGQRLKGGLLSIAVIGGAIMTHLFVIGIYTPEGADIDGPKSPVLFIMAVIFFLVSLWVSYGAKVKQV